MCPAHQSLTAEGLSELQSEKLLAYRDKAARPSHATDGILAATTPLAVSAAVQIGRAAGVPDVVKVR